MITKKISLALSTFGAIVCLTIPTEAMAESYSQLSQPTNQVEELAKGFKKRRTAKGRRIRRTSTTIRRTTRTINTQGTTTSSTTSGSITTRTSTRATSTKKRTSIKLPSIRIRFNK